MCVLEASALLKSEMFFICVSVIYMKIFVLKYSEARFRENRNLLSSN